MRVVKLWQLAHVVGTIMHVLMEFPLASILSKADLCEHVFVVFGVCVCKMVKFVQHANMQFCFKLSRTAAETHKMFVTSYRSFQMVSEVLRGKWVTGRWRKKWSPVDIEKQGKDHLHPHTYLSKPTFNHSETSEETGLSFVSVQAILSKDLNMRWVSTKFIPHILTDDQKKPTFHPSCFTNPFWIWCYQKWW
jgi:hypothetical protein